jgi:hypothetical protein
MTSTWPARSDGLAGSCRLPGDPIRPNRRGLSELQVVPAASVRRRGDGDAVTVDGQAATLVTRPLVLTGLTVKRERQTHRGYYPHPPRAGSHQRAGSGPAGSGQ